MNEIESIGVGFEDLCKGATHAGRGSMVPMGSALY